jgi:NADPH:quinone reductase-like Zn-dependent oxidoreductase
MENKMKAIVYTKYGPPDNLELKEVEKPTPKDNEVLVKVHAVSLNAADLDFLIGRYQPPFSRKPRYKILGSDVAGLVDSVGRDVKQFQPGDEVFGDLFSCGLGAFAEYVCAPEKALALKPASMTFEEVSTLPQSGLLALQGLRNKRQTQPGQKVLINGAGGGMGTFAVQIAKFFEAEVTGVDSTDKLDMMLSIGADHVIDYTQEDFSKSGKRYDLILDVVVYRPIFDYKRVLNPKGIFLAVGGSMATTFKIAFLGPLITMFGSKKMGILVWRQMKKEDLDFLIELFEAGKVVPVIDRRYPLREVAEALRYLEEGHAKGKVIITVEDNNKT